MSQITVLDKNNTPTGPFTRDQIAQKLQHGEIALTDLAFVEGLAEWTPLQQVLAKVDGSRLAPPPAVAPAPAAAAYSYAATMAPPSHIVYAGFWLRFVAYIIDAIICGIGGGIIGGIIGFVFGLVAAASGTPIATSFNADDSNSTGMLLFVIMELVCSLVGLLIGWIYYAKMESSSWQATLGKKAIGLQVTDLEGNRIGFARASGRFFGKIISGMILLIGYIMAGFTERKQALHDMLAGTLVIRNQK